MVGPTNAKPRFFKSALTLTNSDLTIPVYHTEPDSATVRCSLIPILTQGETTVALLREAVSCAVTADAEHVPYVFPIFSAEENNVTGKAITLKTESAYTAARSGRSHRRASAKAAAVPGS